MSKFDLWYILSLPAITLFEGEGGEGGGEGGSEGGGSEGGGSEDGGSEKKFTQADVDKIVQNRLKKQSAEAQRLISNLEAEKKRANITAQERDDLQSRIDMLKQTIETEQEKRERETAKSKKEHLEQVNSLTAERDQWKTKYTKSTISRSITDAAIHPDHDAYTAKTVVAILEPMTELESVQDEDGKPTGEFQPVVNFPSVKKQGDKEVPVTLKLSPMEAVKRMTEMDEYLHLFKGKGTGGAGAGNKGKGDGTMSQDDVVHLARTDPAKYAKLRREGKIKL